MGWRPFVLVLVLDLLRPPHCLAEPRRFPRRREIPCCGLASEDDDEYERETNTIMNPDESDSHEALDPCANALPVILFDDYRRC